MIALWSIKFVPKLITIRLCSFIIIIQSRKMSKQICDSFFRPLARLISSVVIYYLYSAALPTAFLSLPPFQPQMDEYHTWRDKYPCHTFRLASDVSLKDRDALKPDRGLHYAQVTRCRVPSKITPATHPSPRNPAFRWLLPGGLITGSEIKSGFPCFSGKNARNRSFPAGN